MRDNNIKIGDLVCFDGDESQNIFGIGLVADIKGDDKDFEEFNKVIEKIEAKDFKRLTFLSTSRLIPGLNIFITTFCKLLLRVAL